MLLAGLLGVCASNNLGTYGKRHMSDRHFDARVSILSALSGREARSVIYHRRWLVRHGNYRGKREVSKPDHALGGIFIAEGHWERKGLSVRVGGHGTV